MRRGSDEILLEIEEFLAQTGVSATRFGAYAMGDTKLVRSLRKGRKLREATAAGLRKWMRLNRRAVAEGDL